MIYIYIYIYTTTGLYEYVHHIQCIHKTRENHLKDDLYLQVEKSLHLHFRDTER